MKYLIPFLAFLSLTACAKTKYYAPSSCTVIQETNGATINCPDGSNTFLTNGTNGSNGADGLDSIVQIIDPCGDASGHDEILLILSTGEVLAYFESGSNRFLSVLENGNYRTTDAQQCNFTVSNGSVTF